MQIGFWKKLKKPILALAPMADVTDAAFRSVIAKFGKPDVMYTEFTSADGLVSAGHKNLMLNLKFSEKERPIVAQLFSANPEKMREAATLIQNLGFDGIDINMGCPDRKIVKQGAGGALIKTPELAKKMILAAKEGTTKIPVSVKTRIGYSKNELDKWLPVILQAKPAAVIIHARTVKEMSKVPARWEHIAEAVKIRNMLKSDTLILGNGDISDVKDAKKKIRESGADGAMIGRAIFGNPWLFEKKNKELGIKERAKALSMQAKLFERYFKGKRNFALMKKHFKAYIGGFEGAKEIRAELMDADSAKEAEKILRRLYK